MLGGMFILFRMSMLAPIGRPHGHEDVASHIHELDESTEMVNRVQGPIAHTT